MKNRLATATSLCAVFASAGASGWPGTEAVFRALDPVTEPPPRPWQAEHAMRVIPPAWRPASPMAAAVEAHSHPRGPTSRLDTIVGAIGTEKGEAGRSVRVTAAPRRGSDNGARRNRYDFVSSASATAAVTVATGVMPFRREPGYLAVAANNPPEPPPARKRAGPRGEADAGAEGLALFAENEVAGSRLGVTVKAEFLGPDGGLTPEAADTVNEWLAAKVRVDAAGEAFAAERFHLWLAPGVTASVTIPIDAEARTNPGLVNKALALTIASATPLDLRAKLPAPLEIGPFATIGHALAALVNSAWPGSGKLGRWD